MWVTPLRRGIVSACTTCPAGALRAAVDQRRPDEAIAGLLQPLPGVGVAMHGSVQAETAELGAYGFFEARRPLDGILVPQRLAPNLWSGGNAMAIRPGLRRLQPAHMSRRAAVDCDVDRVVPVEQSAGDLRPVNAITASSFVD